MGWTMLRLGKGCSGSGPLPEEDLSIIVSLAFGVWPEKGSVGIFVGGFPHFVMKPLGFPCLEFGSTYLSKQFYRCLASR